MNPNKNIILVHGGFHDESCWTLLVPLLESKGFTVRTLTLSGNGNNTARPYSVSLHTYANDVISVAEKFNSKSILLGHSMGGAVISAAAQKQPELFQSLIYLSAFVLNSNHPSIVSFHKHLLRDDTRGQQKISLLKGTLTMKPGTARRLFYNACPEDIADKAQQYLGTQHIRPMLTKMRFSNDGLGSVRKFFIECLQDQALAIESQRLMQSFWTFSGVETLDSDHSPFLSMPGELADTIEKLSEYDIKDASLRPLPSETYRSLSPQPSRS